MYIDKYVRPKNGDKILDIGCGPADILEYLPNVEYMGFDMNPRYIQFASQRYGNRGNFFCQKVNPDVLDNKMQFDIILAKNILHHLDDNESNNLFELAYKVLKPGGRLITYDPCYVTTQSSISKFIYSLDRGKFIRTAQEYLKIVSQIFSNVTISIEPEIGRFSATVIIMECKKYS
jgi:SAM-dependent methyltransferase